MASRMRKGPCRYQVRKGLERGGVEERDGRNKNESEVNLCQGEPAFWDETSTYRLKRFVTLEFDIGLSRGAIAGKT